MTDTAAAAAAALKAEISRAGLLHDPAGLTDTDINRIHAAATQLHTETNGDPIKLLDAITH